MHEGLHFLHKDFRNEKQFKRPSIAHRDFKSENTLVFNFDHIIFSCPLKSNNINIV